MRKRSFLCLAKQASTVWAKKAKFQYKISLVHLMRVKWLASIECTETVCVLFAYAIARTIYCFEIICPFEWTLSAHTIQFVHWRRENGLEFEKRASTYACACVYARRCVHCWSKVRGQKKICETFNKFERILCILVCTVLGNIFYQLTSHR